MATREEIRRVCIFVFVLNKHVELFDYKLCAYVTLIKIIYKKCRSGVGKAKHLFLSLNF